MEPGKLCRAPTGVGGGAGLLQGPHSASTPTRTQQVGAGVLGSVTPTLAMQAGAVREGMDRSMAELTSTLRSDIGVLHRQRHLVEASLCELRNSPGWRPSRDQQHLPCSSQADVQQNQCTEREQQSGADVEPASSPSACMVAHHELRAEAVRQVQEQVGGVQHCWHASWLGSR